MNSSMEGEMIMQGNRVGAIHLSGEDANTFVRSLFMPTTEEIATRNQYINEVNESILIADIDHGFEANIDDLDLSFLDSNYMSVKLEIQVQINSKVKPRVYNQIGEINSEAYYPRIDLQFCRMNCESNIICAA